MLKLVLRQKEKHSDKSLRRLRVMLNIRSLSWPNGDKGRDDTHSKMSAVEHFNEEMLDTQGML